MALMRDIVVSARAVPVDARSRPAPPTPGVFALSADCRLFDADSGVCVAVIAVAAEALMTSIGRQLRHVRFAERAPRLDDRASGESRLSGIAVSNSTFGYLPPVPLRRRYGCSRCAFDGDYPALLDDLLRLAAVSDSVLDAHPDPGSLRSLVDPIPPAWRLNGTPWTSGVINNNAALPYHRDASNVAGMWSALAVAKRAVSGGWLHLPTYDTYLMLPHGSIALFDGGRVWHGVTPFALARPDGYRYSVVLYARTGMKVCAPDPADEPARAAAKAGAAARVRVESARG